MPEKSAVRSTVHTNPSRKRRFSKTLLKLGEFENTGFSFFSVDVKNFENGAFPKLSSNWGNLKTPAFRFSVDVKNFENGAFRKLSSNWGNLKTPAFRFFLWT